MSHAAALIDQPEPPKSILKKRSLSKSPHFDDGPPASANRSETPHGHSKGRSKHRARDGAQQHLLESPLLSADMDSTTDGRNDDFVSCASRHKPASVMVGCVGRPPTPHDTRERKVRSSRQTLSPAVKQYEYDHPDQQALSPRYRPSVLRRDGNSSRLPVISNGNREFCTIPVEDGRAPAVGSIAAEGNTYVEANSEERGQSTDELARSARSRSRQRSAPGGDETGRRPHSRSRSRNPEDVPGPSPRVHFDETSKKSAPYESDDSRARRQCDLVNLVAGIGVSSSSNRAPSRWSRGSPSSDTCAGSVSTEQTVGRRRSRSLADTQTERQECIGLALGGSVATLQGLEMVRSSDGARTRDVRKARSSSVSDGQNHGETRRFRRASESREWDRMVMENESSVSRPTHVNGPTTGMFAPSGSDHSSTSSIGSVKRDSFALLSAERQRQAFGIPPTSSSIDEGMVSGESQYSLAEETAKGEDGNTVGVGLSLAAEQLFQSLGDESSSAEGLSALSGGTLTQSRAPSPISASETVSSVYDDDILDASWRDRQRDPTQTSTVNQMKSTWRDTLSQSAFASLCEKHGKTEMQRQEVIWELCESEQVLVKQLHTALQVYVHPLLGKDRTWMNGLPTVITRFLDWLDDIFQLHSQIHSALHQMRSAQYPLMTRVAETLRPFMPRLEVYQPYVARLDEVLSTIENLIRDNSSDLGEFVRIQNASPAASGMDMSSYLRLPTKRLGVYLETFEVSVLRLNY